jgi:Uncharacterized protein, involved in the regulation of septum location
MEIKAKMKPISEGNLLAAGEITIDDVITIKGVKAIKIKDGTDFFVSMPQLKTATGYKTIATVKAHEEKLRKAVWEAIVQEVYYTPLNLDFEITIHPVNNGNMLAAVVVNYEGYVNIEGIRVMQGKNGIYVSFPQDKFEHKGKTFTNSFIELPRSIKSSLEYEIRRDYEKVKRKTLQKTEVRKYV